MKQFRQAQERNNERKGRKMKREARIVEYFKEFAFEIKEAKKQGFNYAEVDPCKGIHFCTIKNNATPINWSYGPDCDQFFI